MADFAPELRRILRSAGCYIVRRGKGDHDIWFSPIERRNFVVDSKILTPAYGQRCPEAGGVEESILSRRKNFT